MVAECRAMRRGKTVDGGGEVHGGQRYVEGGEGSKLQVDAASEKVITEYQTREGKKMQ